jgi:putative tRNA adenosine deaminase-associated protein
MAAHTSPDDYADVDGYAVAVVRDENTWTVTLLDPAALESLSAAETALKGLRSAGASFGVVNVDDEYFVIVRPGPAGTRLLLSDATAAVWDDLAEEVLEALNVDIPDLDLDHIDETDPWAEGDLGVLADLGLPEQELGVLLVDEDLYPDEQLQRIAERLGFDEQLSELLDRLG